MSLSILKKLGVGDVKPTNIILQLVDKSLTYPKGVIKNVLVKVNKFIFLADFIVLYMKKDHSIMIILGHLISTTSQALINVCKGKLIL